MKNKTENQQMVQAMEEKFGDAMPRSIEYIAALFPESLALQRASSTDSMYDPNSPFEQKTKTLIYLSAALATNNQVCIKAQFTAALSQGATKEEIIAVVKIVRHAASSGTYGNAEYILENLM